MFSLQLTAVLGNAMGYGHWQSAVYASWDSMFATGLCMGSVASSLRNRQSALGAAMARQSYAVYVVHIPLVVFLAVASQGIEMGALTKFTLAEIIAEPLCSTAAGLVRKIPAAAKVL